MKIKKRGFPAKLREPVTIYAIEFEDNTVYVGISRNPSNRLKQHQAKSSNAPVRERIKIVPYKLIIGGVISSQKDLFMEDDFMDKYREKGFVVLNKRKGGCIGSESKYLK